MVRRAVGRVVCRALNRSDSHSLEGSVGAVGAVGRSGGSSWEAPRIQLRDCLFVMLVNTCSGRRAVCWEAPRGQLQELHSEVDRRGRSGAASEGRASGLARQMQSHGLWDDPRLQLGPHGAIQARRLTALLGVECACNEARVRVNAGLPTAAGPKTPVERGMMEAAGRPQDQRREQSGSTLRHLSTKAPHNYIQVARLGQIWAASSTCSATRQPQDAICRAVAVAVVVVVAIVVAVVGRHGSERCADFDKHWCCRRGASRCISLRRSQASSLLKATFCGFWEAPPKCGKCRGKPDAIPGDAGARGESGTAGAFLKGPGGSARLPV